DRGGAAEAGNVSFSGTLKGSDNTSRGNYMIVSGATKVYLKSVRDYSGWIDSQVRLSATGTINSFTNAYLTK
ncbi:MAG TPA: hypothetical protein VD998_04340, partial [Verrucomicrobiae bacterium]|nr:hypothetical protein [Verrucomicrobiae bacterium]